jgi:hypothetical protein
MVGHRTVLTPLAMTLDLAAVNRGNPYYIRTVKPSIGKMPAS